MDERAKRLRAVIGWWMRDGAHEGNEHLAARVEALYAEEVERLERERDEARERIKTSGAVEAA
jgi:hypothetical protein